MAPRLEGFEPICRKNNEQVEVAADQVNNNSTSTSVVKERHDEEKIKLPIVWRNVAVFAFLHLASIYGCYLCFQAKWQTLLFAFGMYVAGGLGITAGAHRLWAHRTYKAKLPLRILLAFFQTIAVQNSIFEWSRDHRVHHKHSETNADPHNAKRGFFFSHVGWLLMKKHPDVMKKGGRIPLDDLLADPIVYYQKIYYRPLAVLCCFVFPTVFPWLAWNESLLIAYFVPGILRYVFTLHITWLVNSAAHKWGDRPYDKSINPAQNILVSIGAIGEGFHNYHHTFPQDYSTSEFGAVYFNFTKAFIDFMALLGQAYDRNKISAETVLKRRQRTGDLTMNEDVNHHDHEHHSDDEHDY
jgi:stearoyl-CoA desaturase (delta-9 desaturase)